MFERISAQERIDFTKNFALMLQSGIAINEALTAIVDNKSSRSLREALQRITLEIERGIPVSEAFQKESAIFDTVYVSLLRMGESSGSLGDALHFLAEWLERDNDLRTEVKQAMLYPKLLLNATGLLAAGLSMFILPRLVPLFKSLHIQLPLSTRILLKVSVFFRDYWLYLIVGFTAFIILFTLAKRIKSVRKILDTLSIKIPFLGPLMVDYQIAVITHVLATVLRGGMSLVEALGVTKVAATNVIYKDAIQNVNEQVETGTALSDAMGKHDDLFPKSTIVIISVGERTGKLSDSMAHLADFYSKQLNKKTKKLPTILEPALLIIVAFVVGFVAISIITPIYGLTRGL